MPERGRRMRRFLWPGLFLLLLLVLPGLLEGFDSGYGFRLAELALVFAILAASLNLMGGSAGLLSLGHAAFYAIGAYAAGLVATAAHGGLLLTLPASILTAGVLGAVFAVPTIRLLRVFFTVATLGIGEIVHITITNWDGLTGGPNGLRGIAGFRAAGFDLSGRLGTYYVTAGVALAALWCVDRLMHSYYGNALRALREDDPSAGAMGIDTARLKIGAFAISAGLAGAAGCLTAHATGFLGPDMFGLDQSILILAMVVVGGLGSLPGAVIGAVLLTIAPELVRSAGHFRMVLVGGLLFGCIVLLPKGLFSEERALRMLRIIPGRGRRP